MKKSVYAVTICFLISIKGYSGGDLAGNGGHGIVCKTESEKSRIHFLDSFQAEIMNGCKLPEDADYIQLTQKLIENVLKKRPDLYDLKFVYDFIMHSTQLYHDLDHTPARLEKIFDGRITNDHEADLLLNKLQNKCELLQVAVFDDTANSLYLRESFYFGMPSEEVSVLFLHEAIYYILRHRFGEVTSSKVREIVADAICNI